MIGSTLGAYRLEEAIGRGGMGVVYRATDTRLGRTVAVKVLPPATPDRPRPEEQVRRFLKEARAASSLNHPNIVTLYDIGREGGTDFIVMEFVAGRTLAEEIAAGGLEPARAAEIALQIADALAAAHAAGIVHRDLKPQNVMIGDDGRARVLDFGLARTEPAGEGGSAGLTLSMTLTEPGTVVGTPAYMAPEQVKTGAADARTDVHALGAVLYEMLAGAPPFQASSYATIVHAIAWQEPEPILARRPDAPRPLARVIERCLRKDPDERFANGAGARDALAPIAQALRSGVADGGDRVGARMADAVAGAGRALGRRRLLAASGAVILLVAAAAVAWFTLPAFRGGLARMLPAASATPFELYRAGLADLDRYFEPGRIDRAIESLRRAIAADPDYAPGYAGLAEALWRRYRENRDEAILAQAVGNARQAVALDPQLARGHVALGLAQAEARAYGEARAAFEQALRLDPANAQAHRGLGAIHAAEDRAAAADSAFTRAIALAPADWEIRTQRGVLHFVNGRYEDALADFAETARLSPDNPLTYRNVGGAQHMLGRFADAAASFQRSIEIRPDPAVYSNLGTIYFFQGLYPQAVSALEKSVELGPNHATIWRNLGDAYRQVPGKDREAKQAYLRAAQLLRQELVREPGAPVLIAELALCLARRGERDEAARLAGSIDREGRALPEVAYALVLAWEALGDRAAALAALREAVAAGHPVDEIREDPELVDLRRDSEYHRILAALP